MLMLTFDAGPKKLAKWKTTCLLDEAGVIYLPALVEEAKGRIDGGGGP